MDLDDLLALLPDNSSGSIDASDLRTIVTELWNRTTAGTLTGVWQYNSNPNVSPGGAQVTTDTGDPTTATVLRFAKHDKSNVDFVLVLSNVIRIFAQQESDSDNRASWTVTGAATEYSDHIEVPVSLETSEGAGSGTWQDFLFVFSLGEQP